MSAKADENGGHRGEPREHDSMLDDREPPKERPGCLHGAAARLGLTVRWMVVLVVLAVLALVLLTVVAVLAASWPPPPPEDTSVRCETADCLRAAAQVSRPPGAGTGRLVSCPISLSRSGVCSRR